MVIFTLLFGVALPLFTLGVELSTHMCASTLFDPIPTLWHVVLVAFAAIANLISALSLTRFIQTRRRLISRINGVGIGVSFGYFLVFLPLLPLAFIGIVWFGIGMLPLSPMFTFLCALMMRKRLVVAADEDVETRTERRSSIVRREKVESLPELPRRISSVWGWALFGLFLLFVPEAHLAMTDWGMRAAKSAPSAEARATSVRFLRRFGSEQRMLAACYGVPERRVLRLSSFGATESDQASVAQEDARRMYFQVTGKPFNSVEPPRRLRQIANPKWLGMRDFDGDLGGDTVSGRRRGLTLDSSNLKTVVNAEAGTAYTLWTMEFKNEQAIDQEARAQLRLPQGGVVSRLTLWVNGEPREAAFGRSSQVRKAYQDVAVVRRRDPVLVTLSAPDQVLMQCFPVPANGGKIKVRIGITAPLKFQNEDTCEVRLPHIVERNFGITTEEIHEARTVGSVRVESPTKQFKPEDADGLILTAKLSNEQLDSPDARFIVTRPEQATATWIEAGKSAGSNIVQEIKATPGKTFPRLVIVIDGSEPVAPHFDAIADAVAGIVEQAEIHVILAMDQVVDLGKLNGEPSAIRSMLANRLNAEAGLGGCDNVKALSAAWQKARDLSPAAVLWLHGPQPILLSPTELLQLASDAAKTRLFHLVVVDGPNRIVDRHPNPRLFQRIARRGSVAADLVDAIARLTGPSANLQFVRRLQRPNEVIDETQSQPFDNVARLWAFGQVQSLLDVEKPEEAVRLGVEYQLVTPVTGAVVLETSQQFAQHGLTPADAESVPTVPEPEVWALILVSFAVLGFELVRRRRRCQAA